VSSSLNLKAARGECLQSECYPLSPLHPQLLKKSCILSAHHHAAVRLTPAPKVRPPLLPLPHPLLRRRPHSPSLPAQLEAADVVEATCTRLQMHMVMQVGEVQFLHNQHILHRRTAYEDHEDGAAMPKRHLMRIWMATPEGQGGWKLPFPDRDHSRRGGVQVDEREVVAVLEAE